MRARRNLKHVVALALGYEDTSEFLCNAASIEQSSLITDPEKRFTMRLLLVTHYYPSHRGGIEIVAGELAKRLEGRGVRIAWAASAAPVDSIPATAVPMQTWNIAERQLGFPYPLWSWKSLARLRGLVDWCDVVHLHDSLYVGNFLASRMAHRAGKPVVVTQHIGEVPYRNPVLRHLVRFANRSVGRRVLQNAEQTIFISPRVFDYFKRVIAFRRDPLYRANGVDTVTFHPPSAEKRRTMRSELGWPLERLVLLFAGRFVEKKGLHLLREAARQLSQCHFVFAGWGPLDPQSWQLPNVQSVGSLGPCELAALYQSADLLVLPSVGEGFPLVVQEAAACGLPSLISHETMEGQSAITSFTYSCMPTRESLIDTLNHIEQHREELNVRRNLAADYARQHWDWDVVVDEYLRVFNQVIHRRRAAERSS